MALIIEDGTGKEDSNSYQTVEQMRTYALNRGITLSAVDADIEVLSFQAIDYLEAQRCKYQGYKTSEDQALQFPRECVQIYGYSLDNNVIPSILQHAQNQLVMQLNDDVDIQPTQEGGFIIEEELDDVGLLKYSENIGINISPEMTSVDALLKPLYVACGQLGMAVHT